jgi:hypothetical protein
MKKIYIILVLFLFTRAAVALPGTLVNIDPDSAYQGQNLNVQVSYPSGTLSQASPGELKFSSSGWPTFTANWFDVINIDLFNDRVTYSLQVPLNQPPALYDIMAYTGYYDFISNSVIPTDSFELAHAFRVVHTNVTGNLFLDNNSNGIFEPGIGERAWGNKRIDVSPDNISVYTAGDGTFVLDLPNGSHTISYALGAGETITTGNFPAVVNVTTGSFHNLGSIGVNTPGIYSIEAYASLGRRCNRVVLSSMHVHNSSNRQVDVTASLVLSPNIDFRSSTPPPTLISGDTLIWNFTGLNPGGWTWVSIIDSVPAAGDTIGYWLSAVAYNGAIPVDTSMSQSTSLVSCSFDPNDKAVSPPAFPWHIDSEGRRPVLSYPVPEYRETIRLTTS